MCSVGYPSVFHCRCSQHPNDNSDTECQPREDAVAATDSETQLQLDIDRVLRELRTNVVESSTPTSRVSDVTPQVVTAPGRRGVQQRHQSQRQQRGRPRLQSNSLGKKGRPSEAEAAIKMVVDGETTPVCCICFLITYEVDNAKAVSGIW